MTIEVDVVVDGEGYNSLITAACLAMKYAVAAALILLGAQAALADPMKCSGEEKACNSSCLKFARVAPRNCLEACHLSRQICMRTGCWDTGTNRYCGLMKQ